jgi:4-amino-4-deoxy-L-arabinose transferase-like glycosyltransferase
VSRRTAYAAIALAAALPRVGVIVYLRDSLQSGLEKSYVFAQVFVQHGTYGFIPGQPSAYTQPLYGWFLIPIWWLFDGHWLAFGLAQTGLAVVTAWLVYEIARRLLPVRWAVAAAALTTLHPYLVWHDVHVNREIVDQLCAAAVVLLTLLVAERATWPRAIGLGVATGLAMLGNTRLVFLPVVCIVWLAFRLPRTRASALACVAVLAAAGVTVAPWLVRNKVSVGCWAITTDGRALWKANNPQTYDLLSNGLWIDNVSPKSPRPPAPGRLTPEEARGYYDATHGRLVLHPDECLEMTFYEHLAWQWARDHPGDKAKLAALSEQLFWQPTVIETDLTSSSGIGKRVGEPAYMWIVYALAAVGLFLAPRAFVGLALLVFAYESAFVAIFVGATRYRVAFDFLLVVLAVTAVQRLWERRRG